MNDALPRERLRRVTLVGIENDRSRSRRYRHDSQRSERDSALVHTNRFGSVDDAANKATMVHQAAAGTRSAGWASSVLPQGMGRWARRGQWTSGCCDDKLWEAAELENGISHEANAIATISG
jgi:hypothetical protein